MATAVRVQAEVPAGSGGYQLRCHSCSHGVGSAVAVMHLVAMFKASLLGRVPQSHSLEIRKRCPSCGWVNVFHPC